MHSTRSSNAFPARCIHRAATLDTTRHNQGVHCPARGPTWCCLLPPLPSPGMMQAAAATPAQPRALHCKLPCPAQPYAYGICHSPPPGMMQAAAATTSQPGALSCELPCPGHPYAHGRCHKQQHVSALEALAALEAKQPPTWDDACAAVLALLHQECRGAGAHTLAAADAAHLVHKHLQGWQEAAHLNSKL